MLLPQGVSMDIRALRRVCIAGGVAAVAITVGGDNPTAAQQESPLYVEPGLKEIQRRPGTPEGAEGLFDLLDDNNDGVIDSGEWRSQKMFVFYARDANQNYMLTREEIPGIADTVFEAADTDGDGLMSGFEFNQAKFTQFELVDGNVNQTVNFDEFVTFAVRIETGVE